ncbi:MAG TPA: SapC family protein [Cellvibrionaceae bacterium]|nr:SapC family protein [Cellvibrionaceae bacterium]
MKRTELLNNVTHERLKVASVFSAELDDNVVSTVAYITEFANIQKEYPILCRKDPETDEYQAVVLFGFERNENLFLTDINRGNQKNLGWNAEYVPAVMARGPFSIGIHREIVNGIERHNPMVYVDVNHPKSSYEGGQELFLENGGNSSYLNYISNVLEVINDGIPLTKLMFDAFNKCQLLEGLVLDIEFQNQEKLKISGFETINIEKLYQLSGVALEELNRSGFLQAAYFIAASTSNVQKLIDWKNRHLLLNRDKN